ncbi:hypothetical protein R6V09_30520 [Streptomyces sp. W16]|uniref:hypothetical protein n=1 Tax=Streptomyces sp. W16 TaxID=3076631 RepID=UPI00295BBBDE|nr:hypothetical protein [Streptomyces sp. W16]MDV9174429.1 hypothetical protein [Streptomyces sp. W16]
MIYAEGMARSTLAPAARELLRLAADGQEHVAARHLATYLDALDGPRSPTNGDGHRTMTVPLTAPE